MLLWLVGGTLGWFTETACIVGNIGDYLLLSCLVGLLTCTDIFILFGVINYCFAWGCFDWLAFLVLLLLRYLLWSFMVNVV